VEHFVIDFYCPELKLAVEIDGDSHYMVALLHSAPYTPPHPLLGKEGNKGRLSDIQRQIQIEAFGIQFLRFTQHFDCKVSGFTNREVYENLEGALFKIKERIKQITSPTPPCKGGD
jgi:very-short-patch-repair endonuclease